MLELPDYVHAAHRWPTVQHGDLVPGLFSFCFNQMTDHKSLGMPLKGLAKHYTTVSTNSQSSHCKWRSKFTQKFAGSNFCKQNAHTKYMQISTIRKFPTILYQWDKQVVLILDEKGKENLTQWGPWHLNCRQAVSWALWLASSQSN